MKIKFMYNGIKVDGKLYRAWYSTGNYTEKSGIAQSTISITAKNYAGFPAMPDLFSSGGVTFTNNTDRSIDYYDTDRIRVSTDSPFYRLVLDAYGHQEHKRRAKEFMKNFKSA